eukprot:scaffold158_cov388-Prasinococcus_capsulatus_cf.AAC.18
MHRLQNSSTPSWSFHCSMTPTVRSTILPFTIGLNTVAERMSIAQGHVRWQMGVLARRVLRYDDVGAADVGACVLGVRVPL